MNIRFWLLFFVSMTSASLAFGEPTFNRDPRACMALFQEIKQYIDPEKFILTNESFGKISDDKAAHFFHCKQLVDARPNGSDKVLKALFGSD